jgi:2-amino-4-hydroxy-6-hydroxymethyldihydropteridine diphosphokinase
MPVAFVSLGANLGDRAATMDQALRALAQSPHIKVTGVSSFLETEPVGGPPGQGKYLNAVAQLETTLDPASLLAFLLDTEKQLGRVRTVRNAPRTLDLDILLYDDLVHLASDPIIPHPRMHEREFVLSPLSEIAPEALHPIFGVNVSTLLHRLRRGWSHRLDGLRIMVTGSTRGIGRAIAEACAREGADVIVHGRTDGTALATLIAKAGSRPIALQGDLSRPKDCARLIDDAWKEWNGIDVWINNACADILTGAEADQPFEQKLERLLAVDVRATMLLSRAVGERMRATGGAIINIGWDQAETGMEGDSAQLFAATKGAVAAFSKSLAVTLSPQVRVNCIAPGWIRTEWGDSASAKWQERVINETPMRRWGLPEDVAAAAVWLASPAAQFITGQVIRVNGGAVR